MKQLRDPLLIKRWRVSWTHKPTKVRVSDVFTARTKVAARRMAERAHVDGVSFRVGSYHGGVEIPEYHAAPAPTPYARNTTRCVTHRRARRPSGRSAQNSTC